MPGASVGRIEVLIAAGCVLFLVLVAVLAMDHAALTHPDQGLLYAAGATALWRGEGIPFTQRAPLYSMFLAALAVFVDQRAEPATPDAREYGHVRSLDMAKGYDTMTYRRLVLWTQLLLYAASAVFAGVTVCLFGPPPLWAMITAAACVVSVSWKQAGEVHDNVLSLFLLTAAVMALAFAWQRRGSPGWTIAAGVLFALSGICRPTFQLLPLVLAALAALAWTRRWGGRAAVRCALALLLPWILFDGGWSLRNYRHHGFFSVSSGFGIAIGNKVSPFLELASSRFPDELPVFVGFRDKRLVESHTHLGEDWSADASRWLMRQRKMGYLEADRFLQEVGKEAIRRAPQLYLRTIGQSFLNFWWPGVPEVPGRLAWSVYEMAVLAAFGLAIALWVGLHLLGRYTFLRPVAPNGADLILAVSVVIVLYTMSVTSVIDNAIPAHRSPVQFFLPLTVSLVLWRLRPEQVSADGTRAAG